MYKKSLVLVLTASLVSACSTVTYSTSTETIKNSGYVDDLLLTPKMSKQAVVDLFGVPMHKSADGNLETYFYRNIVLAFDENGKLEATQK